MCSLSVCGHGLKIYDNSRFVGSQSHTFCSFYFVCGLYNGTCCCCLCVLMGLVVLFFVAPFSLLAVFSSTSAFNSDLSKWNTGAVTNMYSSKCTLSPSLWPRRLPLWCVVEYIYDNSRFVGSQVSHVLFCSLLFQSVLQQWLRTNTLRWHMGILISELGDL